ncbi:chemotaxis response regulator protein-glutamate methylesterase [Ammoniphilus sp. 3BR4]|uniref:protein-glutamate methylesterase/protein-glutamine glutaminase n=1 Tax=Ammoniphilus sp. 3BR4 TaxID=3158265 RepID=UPI003467CAEF
MKKIRVLVVDDSAFMRKVISDILSQDPKIEVVDKARNGLEGIEKVKQLSPDVVTMDVEMPAMNGLEALDYLMKHHPVPVIMLSSLTQEGASATIKALELGAVDFIPKPSGSISLDIHKVEDQIVAKVKAAAGANLNRHLFLSSSPVKQTGYKIKALSSQNELPKLILIGTSTGGPKALQIVLASLPSNLPAAILIVQHMPSGFTKSLSQRLNSICDIQVMEAEDGMVINRGSAYIAPGDYHMELKRKSSGSLVIRLNQTEPKSGHRPSVDMLFESVAQLDYPDTYAVVMTGMGSDGTKGIKALKTTRGCKEVIAEDESTCVVFGMPKAAIASGNVDTVLPLPKIGDYLAKLFQVQD